MLCYHNRKCFVQLRHGAGQAIVQIARSQTSGLEYAIKFFATEAAYKVEAGLYRREDGVHSSDLVQFLPQVLSRLSNFLWAGSCYVRPSHTSCTHIAGVGRRNQQ